MATPKTDPVELMKQLRAEKIQHEIRAIKAEADITELRLAEARDKERDRQVRGGLLRRLPINGPIQGSVVDTWIEALEHWELRDPGEPVVITIDSPGGSVMDGFAIYDTILRLRRKGHHVTTRGRGTVASMAGILLQAGDERTLDANAQFLIHEISFGAGGKMSEIDDAAAFGRKLQKRLLSILAERSTMSESMIARRWKKTDWWLDAEEALRLGFVDRVE